MIFGKFTVKLDSNVTISPGYPGDFAYQSATIGKVYIGKMRYGYKTPVKSELAYKTAYKEAIDENYGISHEKADKYAKSKQVIGEADIRGLREYYVNIRVHWNGKKWIMDEPEDKDLTTNGLGILLKGELVPIPQAQILYPGF